MKVLFRAKDKHTDNYAIGYEYYNHIEDEYYITHYLTGNNYKIDRNTRSINFEDMLDSQGNGIFASLSEDGKGGDKFLFDNEIFIIWFDNQSLKINATNKDNFERNCHDSLQEWYDFENKCYDLKVIGTLE